MAVTLPGGAKGWWILARDLFSRRMRATGACAVALED